MTSSKGCRAASRASAARRSSVQASAQWMSSTTQEQRRGGSRPPSPARTSACSEPCSRAAVLIAAARARSAGGRRHVEQVVEEQLAVGGDRPGRGGALDRCPALLRLDRAGDAEQAARQAADRVAAGLRAEVEHGGGVAGKAERAGVGRELGDEPRLADARIAADDDDPAALPLGAGRGHGGEVAQLLVPADERAGAHRRGRPVAADAIRRERALLALDLDRRLARPPRNGRPPAARCRRRRALRRARPGCAGGRRCSPCRRSARRCRRARRCAGRRRGRC